MTVSARLRARRRRKFWDKVGCWTAWVWGPLLLVVILAALPLWLPIAILLEKRDEKRKRIAADTTPCARCGRILGQASLARADEVEAEQWRRFDEEHPGVRLRYVRRLQAVCISCGAPYDYRPDTRGFASLDEAELGADWDRIVTQAEKERSSREKEGGPSSPEWWDFDN